MLVAIAGCDRIFNFISDKAMKAQMIEICGEEDVGCIQAVESQFDQCAGQYEEDNQAYMEAPTSREDELLDIYLNNLYGCIVDDEGNPYFEYSPQS